MSQNTGRSGIGPNNLVDAAWIMAERGWPETAVPDAARGIGPILGHGLLDPWFQGRHDVVFAPWKTRDHPADHPVHSMEPGPGGCALAARALGPAMAALRAMVDADPSGGLWMMTLRWSIINHSSGIVGALACWRPPDFDDDYQGHDTAATIRARGDDGGGVMLALLSAGWQPKPDTAAKIATTSLGRGPGAATRFATLEAAGLSLTGPGAPVSGQHLVALLNRLLLSGCTEAALRLADEIGPTRSSELWTYAVSRQMPLLAAALVVAGQWPSKTTPMPTPDTERAHLFVYRAALADSAHERLAIAAEAAHLLSMPPDAAVQDGAYPL